MSSPLGTSRYDAYLVRSSSPDLPSLGDIFKKSPKRPPPLRSGSNATAIPAAVRTTFTSAADILREAPEIDIDTEQITYSPPRKQKPARKSRAKPQPAKDPPGGGNVVQVVELSPDRFKTNARSRSHKPPPENTHVAIQAELPNVRVTKATAANKSKVKKKVETVSNHFTAPQKEPAAAEEPAEPHQPQEPALARRTDWTPPRANSAPIVIDPENDNKELLSSVEKSTVSKDVFQNLFDEFAHKKLDSALRVSREPSETARDVLKKRKRLDLVTTAGEKQERKLVQLNESSPTKQPAAKKKTTTITELATRAYAMPEMPDIDLLAPGNTESLLNYFDTDGHVTSLVEHQSIVMDKNNEKPKKKPAKPRKKKGTTAEDPILLSPTSAFKQSVAQDFVFGTSSQLVTEDSPRTLRNLQAAIQASMQEDDPFASSPTTHVEKRKGLWHAGARDEAGDLLEADTMDLVREEEVTTNARDLPSNPTPAEEEFPDIDDLCADLPQVVEGSTDPKLHFWRSQKHISTPDPTEADMPDGFEPPPSSQLPPSSQQAPSSKTAAPTPAPLRPKYELFTDAQLAKQINSYGFKSMKRRPAMIALLDQCWTSQHPGAPGVQPSIGSVASVSTSAAQNSPKKSVSATKAAGAKSVKKTRGRPRKDEQAAEAVRLDASPKRGRGRPRKLSTGESDSDAPLATRARPTTQAKGKKPAKEDAEIADSENDDSLSLSGQSVADSVFSSPPPIDLSMSEEGETSLNLTPTEQEANLFTHITKVITSAPRSTDPEEPSWYEKMLIYDPVVLEDLTAWLNMGQLTRVGYDGEVSPAEVKKWCESKSVICLWKANSRGKERKRY
ncbi:hypothetical protein BKA67DRAFT_660437 [Truncatella angustata]|uniref:Structure-specific endonuclease subunit SLX4 n=1 Tax=Truncatella angustata TaxID=152316 RepID=A0A9P8UGE2_9PEZI|nr:uncharacterized protein BKA67DRAFT_660437 [Truncatella angustata]KAH6651643.1 hypothetical protein BKA67DRAFT_660437 [Truncatella angustata]